MKIVFNENKQKNLVELKETTAELLEKHIEHQNGKSAQCVFTPPALTIDMLSHIDTLNNKDILIIANIETYLFLRGLKRKNLSNTSYRSIHFLTDNKSLKGKENIIYCDFNNLNKLKLDMKFDIVIGNPPFQDSDNINKSHPLWIKFISLSFELLLKEKGKLLFVTPDSWRTKNSKALQYFSNRKVEYINLDVNKNKYFNVGSTFSYYCISNEESNENYLTKIVNNHKEFNYSLYNISFFPKIESKSFIDKLISSEKFDMCSIGLPFRSNSFDNVSNKKDRKFKHEMYHTNKERLYSVKPHPNQYDKKVILNKTGTWNPFYTEDLGFSHINLAILVKSKKQGSILESYLNSKLIKAYIQAMNVFGARDKFTILNIPKIDISKSWTDQELYIHFNLNQDEIDYIESTVK
jgi:site-specific DNA-methyltransferase (adenine-specific)